MAAQVAKDLLKVINMDPATAADDNELNRVLESALGEARRIGMRGEVVDVGIMLKIMRNNFLQEMQNKSGQSEEEDD